MLTDAQCKRAVRGEKAYRLHDSGGLYLQVATTGHKSWRFKYRFADKEKLLTLGTYPEVTLAKARAARDQARLDVRAHKDPATEKRKARAAAYAAAGVTFKSVGLRWHEAQLGRWSPVQATKVRQALVRDVYPQIGALPLTEIKRPMIIAMLRKIETRGAIDTAKRIRQHVSAIFQFAEGEGLCEHDPAARSVVKSLLPTPVGGSQPGLSDVEAIREMHAKIDASSAASLTKLASRLLALTFVRPGLVPNARWEEFEGIDWMDPSGASDAAEPVWRISAARMKLLKQKKGEQAFQHIAPLPPQAVDVLRAVYRLSGRYPYLFHSVRSTRQPMSNSTIGVVYNREGYTGLHVPHGWRTSFSTIMNELHDRRWRAAGHEGVSPDRAIIDAMLSHVPKGISASELDYNRARYMPRRWELAREWADLTMEGAVPAAALLFGTERAG